MSVSRVNAPPTAGAIALAVSIVLALAGCAVTPKRAPVPDVQAAWHTRKQLLGHLDTWRLHARVGVQLDQKAWHGGIDWRQRGRDFEIDLLSPFGRKVAHLQGDPAGVTLTTSKGERATARDPDALMERTLGFSLPLGGLRYWARGIPRPASNPARPQLDDFGRLRELSQLGWEVAYRQYQPALTTELPKRIRLENEQLKVKLLIKKWQSIPE